jgi:hypothetical protein
MALLSASLLRHTLPALLFLVTILLGSVSAHADAPAAVAKDSIPDSFTGVQRIVAIGDIHGDHERFVAALKLCRIIDDKSSWIAGKTHLVQTGDILDRGPDSKKVMDLLMQLESAGAEGRRQGPRPHR